MLTTAGRLWNRATAPTHRFEKGNLSNSAQITAAKSVQALEKAAQSVADGMFALDETSVDFNQGLPNNVALDSRTKSGYAGVATRSEDGGALTKLEASNSSTSYTVTTDDDYKKITRHTEIDGSAGPIFEEEWAIFNGNSVEYKAFSY